MAHARKQIRDLLVTACTGLATTGSNVYTGQVYPLVNLPCLSIYMDAEVLLKDDLGSSSADGYQVTVIIEGRDKDDDGIEDILDQIAAEVQAAIGADTTLGGKVKVIWLTETTITLAGESEQPTGLIQLSFECIYCIQTSDPETLV